MEKLKILVVDDESRMRKLVKDFLEREGHIIIEAADGMEAMDIFYENKDIALIILDVMMPRMDGWQVCREVRALSQVPIIMLTARGEERDELQGFELGVDEYISKPFSPKILVARVNAILKRGRAAASEDLIDAGVIVIDKAAHLVKIDDVPIDLSVKEFELLTYFVENQKMALSREKILNNVWDYDYFGDARTIDTHVKKLRSKLGEKGNYIKTIWGITAKSGILVGLGETPEEVEELMDDLRRAGCQILTIGQYLQPSHKHYPVAEYVTPAQFASYKETGLAKGFDQVESAPLVRSSYHAEKQVQFYKKETK